MLDTLTSVVEAGAAAPWVLLVVLLVAVFDALVPPLPSEGLVVALAAISVSARDPTWSSSRWPPVSARSSGTP